MHKRKRAGNTITRKINSTKDTAAKADKNHYISNSYLEGFIPIDTEYFTASEIPPPITGRRLSFTSCRRYQTGRLQIHSAVCSYLKCLALLHEPRQRETAGVFFCVNSGSSEAFPIDLPLPVSDDTMIA